MKKIIFILLFIFMSMRISLANEELCINKDGSLCNGEVKYISPTNYYTITNYKSGKKDGLHSVYWKENNLPIERFEYKDGEIISRFTFYHGTDIVKSIASIKDDVPDGKYQDYYKNGKIKTEANYKDGVIEGEVIKHLPNGDIFKSIYTKGGHNWVIDNKIVSINSLYSPQMNGAFLNAVMKKNGIGYKGEKDLRHFPGKYLGLTPLRADGLCHEGLETCNKDIGLVRSLKLTDKKDIKIWNTSYHKQGVLRSDYYQLLQPVSLDYCQSLSPNFKGKFLECNLIKKVEPTTGSIGDQTFYYIYALFEQEGEKLISPLIWNSSEEEMLQFE